MRKFVSKGPKNLTKLQTELKQAPKAESSKDRKTIKAAQLLEKVSTDEDFGTLKQALVAAKIISVEVKIHKIPTTSLKMIYSEISKLEQDSLGEFWDDVDAVRKMFLKHPKLTDVLCGSGRGKLMDGYYCVDINPQRLDGDRPPAILKVDSAQYMEEV